MLRIVVCVSGGGTNLQAIIDRIADGSLRDVEIVRVISNNPGVFALERAAKAGIEGICVSPKDYSDRQSFNYALLDSIMEASPDLVVLAGFLVAIPACVIEAYRNRIINIHPALIPSFCGKGFYGLRVHEKALERGVNDSVIHVDFMVGSEDLAIDGIRPDGSSAPIFRNGTWAE